ncbi:Putative lipoprotein [hydrothermal vent metagenome]|uniref:Putative lipoprotein n=1 Tax=hydrothermal vent metagenome TaxID=652676 RepID=A0A1W1C3V5_9ZZZZ
MSKISNKFIFITTLLTIILNANYSIVKSHRVPSRIDKMPRNIIEDSSEIPQNLSYYAYQAKPLSAKKQRKLDYEYNKKYFSPWNLKRFDKSFKDISWAIRSVEKHKIYNSKYKLIKSSVYDKWIKNSNYENINSVKKYAITIKHSNIHAFPMSQSYYYDPKKTGEGFPFDYNQNSSYHINTPLFVSHYSLDKKWAFVRGSTAYGWISTANIALVSKKFIQNFKNNRYSIVIKDNLRLMNDNKSVSIVKLGSIFPRGKYKDDNNSIREGYLFASKDRSGQAILEIATINQNNLIAKKPIAFTPSNIARVAKELIDEPYGWGGLLEARDCSSMTKDYFSLFGIFLRRNSNKQAQDGKSKSIRKYKKWQKKRVIISKAKPFRSLLYVKGHIVLYIGEYRGEPIIMHTYWGTRLKDGSKYILGRTLISTTEPAKELKNIKESSKLINTLSNIITFGD